MKKFMSECSDWKEITLVAPKDKKENNNFNTEHFDFKVISEEIDGAVALYRFRLQR